LPDNNPAKEDNMQDKEKVDIESLNTELSPEELEQASGGVLCFTCSGEFDCTTKFTCASWQVGDQ
jgi:hypothetical protein